MKILFNRRKSVTVFLLLCFSLSAFAQTGAPLASTIVRLKGYARSSTDEGKTWKLIRQGEVIQPGTLVQTAKKADLDILLGEQVQASVSEVFYDPEKHDVHFISLSEDTAIKLDKLEKQSSASDPVAEVIQLDLRRGSVNGKVKKLPAGSRYEISFIGGVAGMSDAIYKLRASGEMTVLKGKAFVALADGQPARELAAGQEFNPHTGSLAKSPSEGPEPHPTAKSSVSEKAEPDWESRNPRFQLQKPNTGLRRAAP